MKEYYDVIVAGSGIAGLNFSLNLDKRWKILMVAKDDLSRTNTALAQGGIAVARNPGDIESFIEDTIKAGRYCNDRKAVEILVRESWKNVREVMKNGVVFDQTNEHLDFTREGGHSKNRIIHVKDKTGEYVSKGLMSALEQRSNVTFSAHTTIHDLLWGMDGCNGVILEHQGQYRAVYAKAVVLATGGVGGLFKSTTNQEILRGDGIGIALKNHVKCKDVASIQFHPTAFYDGNNQQKKFLITEAIRGEGAILYNEKGERFVDELEPRDVVCKAMYQELGKGAHLYLDIAFKGREYLENRFPAVYNYCMEHGVDMAKEPIPVVPAQHYIMGGIQVDTVGRTNRNLLYALGETACTGVHGKNRLASNSMLEGLVFSRRAAKDLNTRLTQIPERDVLGERKDITDFTPFDPGELVRKEIMKGTKKYHDQFQ